MNTELGHASERSDQDDRDEMNTIPYASLDIQGIISGCCA